MGEQQGTNLGTAIAKARADRLLTQAELAELMRAQGVDWRREQVLRIESGQREVSAHELLVLAHALRYPLWVLLSVAGYPDGLLRTASSQGPNDVPDPVWPSESMKVATGRVLAMMRDDKDVPNLVETVVALWRKYDTVSGRPPSERAERAKRASLWREYEDDPEGFTERTLRTEFTVTDGPRGTIAEIGDPQ